MLSDFVFQVSMEMKILGIASQTGKILLLEADDTSVQKFRQKNSQLYERLNG